MVFFAEVVDAGLGEIVGDSCWLLNDSNVGDFKIVVQLDFDTWVEKQADIAEKIIQNILSFDGFAAAKFYLSEDLLLVLYMQPGNDGFNVDRVLDGIALKQDFQPYNAQVEAFAPVWVANAWMRDSPAIPFSEWLAGESIDDKSMAVMASFC